MEEGKVKSKFHRRSGICIITLSGDLDHSHSKKFRDAVERMAAKSPLMVVLDASLVDYMDSSILGMMLSCSKEATRVGAMLRLVSNDTLDNILSLTRLDGVFTISDSIEVAIEELEAA